MSIAVKLSQKNYEKLCEISVITVFELLCGARYLQGDKHAAVTVSLLASLTVHPFTTATADVAGGIRADLKITGKTVESKDLFIAATAIERDMPLRTRNAKHFEAIPELRIV